MPQRFWEGGGDFFEWTPRRRDKRGAWLFTPGEALPAIRAFIPLDKSPAFENDPAINWRGNLSAVMVGAITQQWLTEFADSECKCEIWADTPAPEPRVFKVETASGISGYVAGWAARANVSLSIQKLGMHHPMLYVWGTLREMSNIEPTDEVGIKLDRRLLVDGNGVGLVALLFEQTKAPSAGDSIEGFLHNVRESARR